jgi:hypothetical protein
MAYLEADEIETRTLRQVAEAADVSPRRGESPRTDATTCSHSPSPKYIRRPP